MAQGFNGDNNGYYEDLNKYELLYNRACKEINSYNKASKESDTLRDEVGSYGKSIWDALDEYKKGGKPDIDFVEAKNRLLRMCKKGDELSKIAGALYDNAYSAIEKCDNFANELENKYNKKLKRKKYPKFPRGNNVKISPELADVVSKMEPEDIVVVLRVPV